MTKTLEQLVIQVKYYLQMAKEHPDKTLAYCGMAASIIYRNPEVLKHL